MIAENDKAALFQITPMLYVLGVLITVLGSYFMINLSFKHFNTTYVIPQIKVGNIVQNLLCGFVILREFGEYTVLDF